jgi:hypothetical protein
MVDRCESAAYEDFDRRVEDLSQLKCVHIACAYA